MGRYIGLVKGPRGERIEVPIVNNRERQTYDGLVNLLTGRAFVMPALSGNSEFSVGFLKTLRRNFLSLRLFIIWDRASYHCGHLGTDYLKQLNGESPEQERLIPARIFRATCTETFIRWKIAGYQLNNGFASIFFSLNALNRSNISL